MKSHLIPDDEVVLRNRIAEFGLQDFCTSIQKSAYSGYLLVGDKQKRSRKLGTSRFAGNPDVPQSFDAAQLDEWIFVYQINLADLPHAKELGLPETGLFSVFSNHDGHSGRVFVFDGVNLVRHHMPSPDPDYIFADMKPWTLNAKAIVDLPKYGDDLTFEIEDAGLDAEYEKLSDFVSVHGFTR